jgi:ribosomal protein S18 acetylase RimI-like enzyme
VPQIKRLADLQIRAHALAEIKEIFFLTSSKKVFASNNAREEFFTNYTSYYIEQIPELTYLALSDEGHEVLGYLTGCLDTMKSMDFVKHGSMRLFAEFYGRFPAHFHINLHPSAQGQGIGSKLTDQFIADAEVAHATGVHIITSPHAANVNFYKKNGFDFLEERKLNEVPVLFMGRVL